MIHREAVTAAQLTSVPKYPKKHSKLLQEHTEPLLCITHELNSLRKRNFNRDQYHNTQRSRDQFTSPNYQNTNQFQITHKHVM